MSTDPWVKVRDALTNVVSPQLDEWKASRFNPTEALAYILAGVTVPAEVAGLPTEAEDEPGDDENEPKAGEARPVERTGSTGGSFAESFSVGPVPPAADPDAEAATDYSRYGEESTGTSYNAADPDAYTPAEPTFTVVEPSTHPTSPASTQESTWPPA